uniref:Uncharacterized protein LOC108053209 n=1 Tax=Drosophila rhopaloa TaxID=1041015 RepID=A0A6P4G1E9_DRORH
MAKLLNNLKRKLEDDSSSDSGLFQKRFKNMNLIQDADSISSCSIPLLDSDDSLEPGVNGYLPELGPNENPYYLQNMMLHDLHMERVKRRIQYRSSSSSDKMEY